MDHLPLPARTAIAAGVLLGITALACAPREAQAATRTVTTCADTGAGSLRATVAAAASGDTVDLRSLACNRIVLTGGAIDVPQRSLTVRGPGYSRFAISGNWATRVFRHAGAGTLSLRGVTIEQGQHRADTAEGGCLWSFGNLDLNDVHVRHCAAYAKFGAVGGGLYAEGDINLFFSAVYSNGAKGAGSDGGGMMAGRLLPGPVFKGGHIRVHRSRIFDNTAGFGGALRANNGLDMTYSTVSGNHARNSIGALEVLQLNGGAMRIAYSTISGNSSAGSAGALNFGGPDGVIYNSTISGNTAQFLSVGELDRGVVILNSTIAFNNEVTPFGCTAAMIISEETHIESSIIARNACNGEPSWDFRGPGGPQPPPTMIVGGDNLIEDSLVPVPADTITGLDPQLGPLADNGGRTWTHLPIAGSRVLDRGNNVVDLATDQRGEGFPRVRNGRADIGAVER
jgi:hypothetical protein